MILQELAEKRTQWKLSTVSENMNLKLVRIRKSSNCECNPDKAHLHQEPLENYGNVASMRLGRGWTNRLVESSSHMKWEKLIFDVTDLGKDLSVLR